VGYVRHAHPKQVFPLIPSLTFTAFSLTSSICSLCSLDDMYSLLHFLRVPECADKSWWKMNINPSGDLSALKVLSLFLFPFLPSFLSHLSYP